MKKTLLLAALLATAAAHADFVPDSAAAPTSAAAVQAVSKVTSLRQLPDDSHAVLEGHITGKVRHEHYTFRDSSGQIEVEIDDDVWRGVDVSPKDKVRLSVKVDQEHQRTEVDVKSVEKIR